MDQRQLEEMKHFDPRFAKYAENNPDLTLAVGIPAKLNAHSKRKPNGIPG
jgi:hypothetical protein